MGHDEVLQVLKEKMRLEGQLESLSSEANQVMQTISNILFIFLFFWLFWSSVPSITLWATSIIQVHTENNRATCYNHLPCLLGSQGEDRASGPACNSECTASG